MVYSPGVVRQCSRAQKAPCDQEWWFDKALKIVSSSACTINMHSKTATKQRT